MHEQGATNNASAATLTGGWFSSDDETPTMGHGTTESRSPIETPAQPKLVSDTSATDTPTGSSFLSDDEATPSVQSRTLPAEVEEDKGSPKPRKTTGGKEVCGSG